MADRNMAAGVVVLAVGRRRTKNKNVIDVDKIKENTNGFKEVQNKRYGRERFVMNRRTEAQNGQKGKMWNEGRFGNVNNKWQQNNRFEYRRRKENKVKEKDKEFKDSQKVEEKGSTSKKNNNEGGILGSNRFTLLDSLVNEEELVPTTDKRKIVDDFLHKKCEMNNMEMNDWSEEMKRYYRDKKELIDAAKEMKENEDVLDENDDVDNIVLRNEVEGAGRNLMF
nr:hypothetical protein [Tanacetum cinerariifolium]